MAEDAMEAWEECEDGVRVEQPAQRRRRAEGQRQ